MFELVKRVPGAVTHVCRPRNQVLATQLRPCLVSSLNRPALILYGRPCDRNHCLVHLGIITRLVPVSRSPCFCLRFWWTSPWFFTSPLGAIKRSNWLPRHNPDTRTSRYPVAGGNSLSDRLLTGSIWFYLFLWRMFRWRQSAYFT